MPAAKNPIDDILGRYGGVVTVVSLTTFAWIRRFNWPAIAVVGQTVAVITLFGSMMANNFTQLSILTRTMIAKRLHSRIAALQMARQVEGVSSHHSGA